VGFCDTVAAQSNTAASAVRRGQFGTAHQLDADLSRRCPSAFIRFVFNLRVGNAIKLHSDIR
jgi:hypothetical protein